MLAVKHNSVRLVRFFSIEISFLSKDNLITKKKSVNVFNWYLKTHIRAI